MEYIKHITLNSGHIRKTYPREVNKQLYFKLKSIFKDSQKDEGAEIFPGYVAKTTVAEIGALITVFANKEGSLIPILTTGISKNDYASELWRILHETVMFGKLATKIQDKPPIPYIADRIEAGAVFSLDAVEWTGDFSRCMGWIYLAPEKIR